MKNEESIENQIDLDKESDPRVDLAIERTELALERTQLAWMRTVLGFIGSGIALDKGVEAMHKTRLETGNALFNSAHVIGISLSVVGTLLMLIVTFFYLHRSRALSRMKGTKPVRLTPGTLGSMLIILLGLGISFLLLVS